MRKLHLPIHKVGGTMETKPYDSCIKLEGLIHTIDIDTQAINNRLKIRQKKNWKKLIQEAPQFYPEKLLNTEYFLRRDTIFRRRTLFLDRDTLSRMPQHIVFRAIGYVDEVNDNTLHVSDQNGSIWIKTTENAEEYKNNLVVVEIELYNCSISSLECLDIEAKNYYIKVKKILKNNKMDKHENEPELDYYIALQTKEKCEMDAINNIQNYARMLGHEVVRRAELWIDIQTENENYRIDWTSKKEVQILNR